MWWVPLVAGGHWGGALTELFSVLQRKPKGDGDLPAVLQGSQGQPSPGVDDEDPEAARLAVDGSEVLESELQVDAEGKVTGPRRGAQGVPWFFPIDENIGAMEGYVFAKGPRGMGYYESKKTAEPDLPAVTVQELDAYSGSGPSSYEQHFRDHQEEPFVLMVLGDSIDPTTRIEAEEMFDTLAAKHQQSTVQFLKINADKVLTKKWDKPGLRLSVRFDAQRYNEKRLPEDRSNGISIVDRRSEPGYFLVQKVDKTCQGYQAYPCQGYRRGIQKNWRWKRDDGYSELKNVQQFLVHETFRHVCPPGLAGDSCEEKVEATSGGAPLLGFFQAHPLEPVDSEFQQNVPIGELPAFLVLDKGRLFSHLVSDEDLAIFPTRDGGIMFFADVLDASVEAVKTLRAREMVVPFALNLLVPGLSAVEVTTGQEAQSACMRDHIPGNKMPEVEELIGIPHANWCTGRFEKEAWTKNGRPVYKSTKTGKFKGTHIVNVAEGSHETKETEQEIQCWLWWFPDQGRPRDGDDMTTDGDPSRRGWWLTPDHPPTNVAQIPYFFTLRELEQPEGKKPVVGKIARAYAFRPTGLEDDDSLAPPSHEWRVRSSLNRGAEKLPNDHAEEYECDKWKPEWGVASNEMTVTTALDEAADA